MLKITFLSGGYRQDFYSVFSDKGCFFSQGRSAINSREEYDAEVEVAAAIPIGVLRYCRQR